MTPTTMAPATAPTWTRYTDRQRRLLLSVLFLVSTSNYVDRAVIAVILEPIKHEFHVSDTMLGLLGGFAFAAFYALFGIPVARWADRGNRRTVITAAVAVWSTMTALCGLAQSFWQLLLARVGVGAGEGGATPAAQSLIADYFRPERRASALAIFTMSGTAGYLLGLGLGGYITANHGWRATLLLFAAPGAALTLLARVALSEPRLTMKSPALAPRHEKLYPSLVHLSAKRSYCYGALGLILYFFMPYGVLIFVPSYLTRVLHVPLAELSVAYGTVSAGASLVGTLGGGWLADRLMRRDVRWLAWLPAISCALSGVVFLTALSMNHFWSFLAITAVAFVLLEGGLPPVFAAIHAVCGSARRALAIALVLFAAQLVGGGFGPLASGALSDAFQVHYGAASLRPALMIMTATLLVTAAVFYLFGRAMPLDLEE